MTLAHILALAIIAAAGVIITLAAMLRAAAKAEGIAEQQAAQARLETITLKEECQDEIARLHNELQQMADAVNLDLDQRLQDGPV